MPGPVHVPVLPITITTTGALIPNRFVGVTRAQCLAAANTYGVSVQAAASGDDATIETKGVISVESGAAVTRDGLVESDATGRAINRSAGVVVARALDAATAAGQMIRCVLISN